MKLYKYTGAKYALEYLKTKELKVATLADVNDPNEWMPYMQNEADGGNYLADSNLREDFKRRREGISGFISFSSQMDNKILWAHYGDKFKGIALEFEVKDGANVFPVRYQATRYLINNAELKACDQEQFQQQLQKAFAQKDVVWQHESEWRILAGLSSCRIVVAESGQAIYLAKFSDKIRLSGMVLGPECPVKFGHVLNEVEDQSVKELTLRRLAYDSLTYSLYVSDACQANLSELQNIKTIVRTCVARQIVPFTGNE